MKTSNKYAPSDQVRSAPEIIQRERAKNGNKTKAREPHTPLSTSTKTKGG